MILADKIIRLRKKNGWSQEELAERMNVSRQAVSKWEAAQTTPDLEKILLLGNLFGVTTDYLLKDELEDEEFIQDSGTTCKTVTLEEAGIYLAYRKWAAGRIALATFLCILSPLCLFFLIAMVEGGMAGFSENTAVFCGLAVMLITVAVAAAIFIYAGFKNDPYVFLEKGEFELAYGVSGMVKQRQKDFRDDYVKSNIIGTCLCILAPIILLLGAFAGNGTLVLFFLCVMLLFVGVAVMFFIRAGVQWASMERLLREGEYSPKNSSTLRSNIESIYWLLVTAVFLAWSFLTGSWHITWIIWPIAGVLFAALMIIVKLIENKTQKN